jgi:hypothetical protein
VLREHVLRYARHKERLQLTVGQTTWLIDRPSADRPFVCHRCRRQLTVAALHAAQRRQCYCVACALR